MNLQAVSIRMLNFKGARDLTINLQHKTDISGKNATLKSTIFDAFKWCLTGKNAQDEKIFNIKTLDENNVPYPELDHEVEIVFLADGKRLPILRGIRENWVTQRGSAERYFKGNDTYCKFNDDVMDVTPFQAAIYKLIPEDILKIITDPFYFESLDYKVKRNILLSIAGEINDTDILKSIRTSDNKKFIDELIEVLGAGRNFEAYKKTIASQKTLLMDELGTGNKAGKIQTRIDEVSRQLPELADYAAIQQQITLYEARVKAVDESLGNAAKAQTEANQSAMAKNNKLHILQMDLQKIEFDLKGQFREAYQKRQSDIKELLNTISAAESSIRRNEQQAVSLRDRIQVAKNNKAALLTKWHEENNKQIAYPANLQKIDLKETDLKCPACQRAFDDSDIESRKHTLECNLNEARTQFEADFNTKKVAAKATINAHGKELAGEIERLDTELQEVENLLITLRSDLDTNRIKLENLQATDATLTANAEAEYLKLQDESAEHIACNNAISELQAEIAALHPWAPDSTTEALKSEKNGIQATVKDMEKKLATKEQRENINARIKELHKQQTDLAQQLADLQGCEFALLQFTKVKMDMLIERINGKFKFVRFKMFKEQINGGTEEICETLIPGPSGLVPWSDANTGGRVLAGIDIINSLCDFYGYRAPIFADNAESVTSPIQTDSQLIRLIASPLHNELTVEYPGKEVKAGKVGVAVRLFDEV